MKISMRKISAIFDMKLKMLLKNPSIMTGPLMAIGFVIIFKNIMPKHENDTDLFFIQTYVLQLGVLFNIMMTGIMAASMPLAEEKEKNTLRVLMTSSVNGREFFIGSLTPVLLIMIIVNLILLPVSDNMAINIPVYFIITTFASIITLLIGAVIGLVSKNQMSTSIYSVPIMLILMMIPLFGGLNKSIGEVSKFIYTGSTNSIIERLVINKGNYIIVNDIIIILIWFVAIIGTFLIFYRKNGLEND